MTSESTKRSGKAKRRAAAHKAAAQSAPQVTAVPFSIAPPTGDIWTLEQVSTLSRQIPALVVRALNNHTSVRAKMARISSTSDGKLALPLFRQRMSRESMVRTATRLDAELLLHGHLSADQRLEISVSLFETKTGDSRYEAVHHASLEDLFQTAGLVVTELAAALRVDLPKGARQSLLEEGSHKAVAVASFTAAMDCLWALRLGVPIEDPDLPLRLLTEALDADPQFSEAEELLTGIVGERLLADEEPGGFTIQVLRALVDKNPANTEALGLLGSALARVGETEEARSVLEECLTTDPGFAPARIALADLMERIGDHEAAIQEWKELTRTEEKNATALSRLASLLMQAGRAQQAIKTWRQAIEADPEAAGTYSDLGIALEAVGKSDEARKVYEEGLSAERRFHGLYHNYGLLLYREGEMERAEQLFAKALAIAPNSVDVNLSMASVLTARGQIAKARSHFERVVELDPRSPMGRKAERELFAMNNPELEKSFQEAAELVKAGRNRKALKLLKQVVEKRPDFWNAWLVQGIASRQVGRLKEAVECFRKVIEIYPEQPDAYNELGLQLLEARQYEEAHRTLNLARGLRPQDGRIRANLALALAQLNKLEEAERELETARRLLEDSSLVEEYLKVVRRKKTAR